MAETNETPADTHKWVNVRHDGAWCVILDGEPPLFIGDYLTAADATKVAAKLRYAIHNIVAFEVHHATAALRERVAAAEGRKVLEKAEAYAKAEREWERLHNSMLRAGWTDEQYQRYVDADAAARKARDELFAAVAPAAPPSATGGA